MAVGKSSKRVWSVVIRSPKSARRVAAWASAVVSRSSPIMCTCGNVVRKYSLCPPAPKVASRMMGGFVVVLQRAGARSSVTRSRSTGT